MATDRPRLALRTLTNLESGVARPAFDPRTLKCGILHLGVGNFHRAHQAVFTEDAIARAGGDWGIVGASLRHGDTAHALRAQDCLYAIETLSERKSYRVMGVLRDVIAAVETPERLLAQWTSGDIHVATLTITEKGYCLDGTGSLNTSHPDIRYDLTRPDWPRSAIGWIVRGLAARKSSGAGPLTIVSCDNLAANGGKLAQAVCAFAQAIDPTLVPWIDANVRFPNTMVDCIVPATSAATIARVDASLGVHDQAPVAREAFAQWVIEDRFAGPRPAWDEVGVEIVGDVVPFERLKLHVLNAAHSALAYLGLPRGHQFVREAIADPELRDFLDSLVAREMAPALAPLDVASYWKKTRDRFANPNLDHRLAQIAEDGSAKLGQRVFPLLVANVRHGRPFAGLARIVRTWLDFARKGPVKDGESARIEAWAKGGGRTEDALDDPALFPDPFRKEEAVRRAVLGAS